MNRIILIEKTIAEPEIVAELMMMGYQRIMKGEK